MIKVSGYGRIGNVSAENAELTRVGSGTPMGEVLRRYGQPVCLDGVPAFDDQPAAVQRHLRDAPAARLCANRIRHEICPHRETAERPDLRARAGGLHA
ncbi:MAG: hypothetical protein EXR29_01230 [Betaproteobacteria bacterium]|nr:hypothetical protein [Betaproteobacteria bacterium]